MRAHICFTLFFLLTLYNISGQRSEAFGGAAPLDLSASCLTPAQHDEIVQRLLESVAKLQGEGFLTDPLTRGAQVAFEFPMRWSDGFDDYGFYGISNFVDHDETYPNALEDFNCGTRTYDTNTGYNHRGIDYFLWPFQWNLVESDAVSAVAAAPGMIIVKDDGNPHTSCGASSLPWNAVYLMHEDGSTSWYGHLKNNSLTTKEVGEHVETGEFLGIIASSGNSTAPHLHFESYDLMGTQLIDPYAGACNDLNTESRWIDQRPYYDPAVNKIQTHFAPPEFQPCPEPDILNASDVFEAGDLVYFVTYFRDQRNTDFCIFNIIKPNDELWQSWTFTQPQSYFPASYWYWSYTLPLDAMEGTWKFRCIFGGKTYIHEFEVLNGTSSTKENTRDVNKYYLTSNADEIQLQAECLKPFEGEFLFTDIHGTLISKSQVDLAVGQNSHHISVNHLPAGCYVVTLISSDGYVDFIEKIIRY